MKSKLKKVWIYLAIVLAVSLTIFIIQNINGHETDIPKIVFDINSGVIGAILTTIITLLLLANQSEIQDSQTKNSVIYEEKLKLFNEFLSILSQALDDGKLTATEMKKIIFSYSTVRMHISPEGSKTIEAAIQSIDAEFFYVDENYVPRFDKYIELFNTVCNVFRKELYALKKDNALPQFEFDNFYHIAFKKRALKLPIYKIEEVEQAYISNQNVIHFDKEGVAIQFTLSKELIALIPQIYEMVDQAIKQLPEHTITMRYLLNMNTVNNKQYLGIFNIYYYIGDRQIATYGLSEKNRLYFKIKLEKESVYSFESDSSNVQSYSANILKDLQNVAKEKPQSNPKA